MTVRKRPLPPDPGAAKAHRILDQIKKTVPLETRPVVLSEEYLRAVKQVEALPENQDGSDKTWVERAQREFREHHARARRIPLKPLEPFPKLIRALQKAKVRFVLIGIAGANYFAETAGLMFTTQDRDLFLPADPANELKAWQVCRREGLDLWYGDEPLGEPLDALLAEKVVSNRGLVRVRGNDLLIDLTLVMAAFEFDEVWSRRRNFKSQGVTVPVAALSDIVASKAAAGRPKDQLFLATHEDALRQLLGARFGRKT